MPQSGIPLGVYELPRRSGDAHFYRLQHPLGEAVVAHARSRDLSPAEIAFDYTGHSGKISAIEALLGQSGWLEASLVTIEALDVPEDRIVIIAVADDGREISEEVAARLLALPGRAGALTKPPEPPLATLAAVFAQRLDRIQREVSDRNGRFFEAEAAKLDGWADDLKVGLEREIKELDRQIKEARRYATGAVSLELKLAAQKEIRALEAARNQKRRTLFDAQDRIDKQRADLIAGIESRLRQKVESRPLLTVRWTVV